MFKKVVVAWFLLLILEIGAGFFVYGKVMHYKKQQAEKEALSKIVQIDKEKVIKNIDSELKHYWEYKPNSEAVDKPYWLEKEVAYSINADGLNDSYDYPVEKGHDTFRIITLGESFTFGQYVNTNKNWTELLEKKLNESRFTCQTKKIEVINLGMPGFDVQEIVRRYKRIGQKYNPDMIIYFESGSGFIRFIQKALPYVDECLSHSDLVEISTSSAQENMKDLAEANFLKVRKCWDEAAEKVSKDYSLPERKEILEGYWQELFALTENRPVWFFYYEDLDFDYKEIVNDWMKKYQDKQYFIKIPKSIKGKNIFIDDHPNELGHQEIAKVIYDTLLDKQAVCLAR